MHLKESSTSEGVMEMLRGSESTSTVQERDLRTMIVCAGETCPMSYANFPPELADYLQENSIDPSIYDLEGRKYFYSTVSFEALKDDAVSEASLLPCELVPGFYSVHHSFSFSSSKLYRDGSILPMDIGSGLAVHLLELKPSDHILDLCCAPGGKLVLAGLLMGKDFDSDRPEANGTLTGVDIAAHRLATCRSLLKKYKIPRTRLFCTDGTLFDERVRSFSKQSITTGATRFNNFLANPFHETTDFRKRPTQMTSEKYDKVLVDAQCTHDGSTKHIKKHIKSGWEGFDLSQFTPSKLDELYQLQLQLLENGFRMLKPGGTIIYSTCSLSTRQDEDIVAKFLERNPDACPYEFAEGIYCKTMQPPEFDSGFFVSRFRKNK